MPLAQRSVVLLSRSRLRECARTAHRRCQLMQFVSVSGIPITFAKHGSVIEVPAGSSAQIMCRTKSAVRECQWSWRQLNQSQPWNLDVKSFPAFGNSSTECSIKFKNVLPEQEGYWTCGARIDPNSSFTQSTPVRFLISEGIKPSSLSYRLIRF